MTTDETTEARATEDADALIERVRERYAAAAQRAQSGGGCGCGSDACCSDTVTGDLYAAEEVAGLPAEAALASLGCGNPTALIDLHEGETVLDLGSGGGLDVLLSAKRVGSTGFVYGLDMTDEMLALAQENKARAGARNVAFLRGRIEEIPLPAASVDVVISNCVINLAADKSLVLRDAFRVLKPGGRFAVSDVVADGPVPAGLRHNMEAWVGCLAGALSIEEYQRLLTEAGFAEVSIEITRRYTVAEAGLDPATLPEGWEAGDGKLASAFVRATRPTAARSDAPAAGTVFATPVALVSRAEAKPTAPKGCC
ncbi:MAG TPA: arsenite methyltransferase [Ktedonobacterales bacterium]|jgi:ubiquinone/menaquinone biosynthesis C-methylase UbiE